MKFLRDHGGTQRVVPQGRAHSGVDIFSLPSGVYSSTRKLLYPELELMMYQCYCTGMKLSLWTQVA